MLVTFRFRSFHLQPNRRLLLLTPLLFHHAGVIEQTKLGVGKLSTLDTKALKKNKNDLDCITANGKQMKKKRKGANKGEKKKREGKTKTRKLVVPRAHLVVVRRGRQRPDPLHAVVQGRLRSVRGGVPATNAHADRKVVQVTKSFTQVLGTTVNSFT